MISLTDSAVKQLLGMVAEQDDPAKGLRIFVESGGCAGMQYGMSLDGHKADDLVTERDGARVFVDPQSEAYLRGSTIDYCDDLTGTGFRIRNPNAVRSCGCGTSFETGPAEEPAQSSHAH